MSQLGPPVLESSGAVLSRVRPALALLGIAVVVSVSPTLLSFIVSGGAQGGVLMVAKIAGMVGTAIALVVSSFFTSVAANAVPG